MTGAGITQTYGFHRSEAHRIDSALSHDLDRHTALIDLGIHHIELVHGSALGRYQSLIERLVLSLIHRAVEVVVSPSLAVARLKKGVIHINALSRHYRSSRVKKAQTLAETSRYIGGERLMGQRTRSDDHNAVGRYLGYLLTDDLDVRITDYSLGHHVREQLAVYRQGSARGDGASVGTAEQQGAESTHLLLEQTRRGVYSVSFE